MATVNRSARGVRRAARARSRADTTRRAKARTSGLIDRLMAALPFTEAQLHRAFLWLILVLLGAIAWIIASLAGLPGWLHGQVAQIGADAGFEVRHVRVSGAERMDERRVYERVIDQHDQPMAMVDVALVRERLLELPWVKDARVSRQLPDTLAIDIVERVPYAALQKADRLVLVDVEGVELEPVSAKEAARRLVISGLGARRQIAALDRLLDAAPALRQQIASAEWVGNRRWNLTFRTGQVLALPQGEEEAAGALVDFARLDGQNRLLGGLVESFDMRTPPRLYMRVPGLSERQVLDASAHKAQDQQAQGDRR